MQNKPTSSCPKDGHHEPQHNNKYKETQHAGNVIILSVTYAHCHIYAESFCRFAECHYADCRGAEASVPDTFRWVI